MTFIGAIGKYTPTKLPHFYPTKRKALKTRRSVIANMVNDRYQDTKNLRIRLPVSAYIRFTQRTAKTATIALLLVGTSVSSLWWQASAQENKPKVTSPDKAFASPSEQVEFVADQLVYNPDTREVRAIGNVTLKRDGYTLKAGEIFYSETSGQGLAVGCKR